MRDNPRWRRADRSGSPSWALYALILLLDLAIVLLVLGAFVELGDWVEDLIWPGGVEWIE